MKVKIGEIDLFSSIAYPDKPSTVIYFQGCNFECPWCWNSNYLDSFLGEERNKQSSPRNKRRSNRNRSSSNRWRRTNPATRSSRNIM